MTELFEKICVQLQLGELTEQPRPLSGGFLHKMYSLFTTEGKYAVKLLNPYIMKRESAAANFRAAEELERMLERRELPILPALIFNGKKMQELEGQYFYLFPWFGGKALKSEAVTAYHCRKIGESLARIHGIARKEAPFVQEELRIDWDFYIQRLEAEDQELCGLLRKNRNLLYRMQDAENAARGRIPAVLAICHNDMDCKNVLWNGAQMRIIDLECLSYGSPFMELYETALCWSGYENCAIDFERLRTLISSYREAGGSLSADWAAVHDSNMGRLGWLEYNLKRALGIECAAEERAVGVSEVRATMPRIVYYDAVKEKLLEVVSGQ